MNPPALSLEQIHGAIAFYLDHQAEIDKYLVARRAKERNEAVGRLHPTFQREAYGERLARSGTIGFSGAVSGLSAHLTAGSSQLIH